MIKIDEYQALISITYFDAKNQHQHEKVPLYLSNS